MSGDFGPSGSGIIVFYVRLAKKEGGRIIAKRARKGSGIAEAEQNAGGNRSDDQTLWSKPL
jgi:hypothetical protein